MDIISINHAKSIDQTANPSNYLFFRNQWASWIEQAALASRGGGGGLRLPKTFEVVSSSERGIAVEVGSDPESRARAIFLYGAKPLDPDVTLSESLSPEGLLTRLPWIPVDSAGQPTLPLPDRLMVRVSSPDENVFQGVIQSLIEQLYQFNTPSANHIVLKATLLKPEHGYDALVFINQASSASLQDWFVSQKNRSYLLRPYRPYELVPGSDQVGQPRGVWLPYHADPRAARSLPFFESIAEHIRRTQGSEVCLVDQDETGKTWLTKVDGSFHAFYFLGRFNLNQLKGEVASVGALKGKTCPFTLHLDLREDTTMTPRQREDLTSIAEAERHLRHEIRYLEHRRQVIQSGQAHSSEMETGKSARSPRSLYLFYEQHSGNPSLARNWPVLQEVILNSSLAELRALQHAYFALRLPDIKGTICDVTFHLVGLNPHNPNPRQQPPGLESADLTFDRSQEWFELGHHLFLPRGYTLYPPLLPTVPGPRLHLLARDTSSTSSDSVFPGKQDERQMFNDLLAQSLGLSSPDLLDEQDLSTSGSPCLIYADPVTKARLPLFLPDNIWKPLSEVAPAHWNQDGLQGQLKNFINRAAEQVIRELSFSLPDLECEVEQVLDQSKTRLINELERLYEARCVELEDRRRSQEARLQEKTAEQARRLAGVQQRWLEVEPALNEARSNLISRIKVARQLIQHLRARAEQINNLSQSTAETWEDLVNQLVAVNQEVQQEADGSLNGPEEKMRQAEIKLAQQGTDLRVFLQPRLDGLTERLEEVGNIAQGQTDYLTQILNQLAQARTALVSNKTVVPLAGPSAGTSVTELVSLQQEVERLRQKLADSEKDHHSLISDYETKLRELGNRAALTDNLEEQLKGARRDSSQREKSLEENLRKANRELSSARSDLREITQENERAKQSVIETQQRLETDLKEMESQNRDLTKRLTTLQEDLRQFEVGSESLDNSVVLARFKEILTVLDNLQYAEAKASPAEASGFVLIRKTFRSTLQKLYPGLEFISPAPGSPFDPKIHEAIDIECDLSQPDGIIINGLLDGVLFREKVKRPARVIVNHCEKVEGAS